MKMHFTKMLSVCCAIILGAFLVTETNAQCLTAGFGQWPSSAFEPACDGAEQTISSSCWTDEFSVVNVVAGEEYTFSSSDATHLITISADGGATAAAFGTGSVTWTAAASGSVNFYTHLSAACDGEQSDHSRNVACGATICPDGNPGEPCDDGNPNTLNDEIQADCSCQGVLPTGGCQNGTSFPSAGEDLGAAGNQLVTISTCSFTTEYTEILNVPAGEDLEFTIVEGGYITVRSDSAGGPVVAEGNSPVTVSGTSGANLFAHWTLDAACTSESSCVETQVQCTTCGSDCPDGNIGDSCDDGDPNTINDEIQPDCSCAGIPQAPNDNACAATELACGDTLAGQTLANASASGPNNCDIGSDKDIWYKVTTDGSTAYRFDQIDSDGFFDAIIEVYLEGADCNDLDTLIECQDFDENFADGVDLPSAAGTYYIRVLAEFASDEGDVFEVSLTCSTVDCPGLGDIGDSCDDGDPNTLDDVVTADCTCEGIPLDCPGLGNIGDSCDDGDPNTSNDTVQPDCTCSGVDGCVNGNLFPGAAVDISDDGSALVNISNCSFQTEYSQVTGVSAGDDIEFTSSDTSYITVREGAFDGPIVAEGFSPVSVSGASGADLFAHWTVDDQCNTATSCIVTNVQCTSCGTDCPDGNIGDACDDGDPNTIDDTIQPDCSCAGILVPANNDCADATLLACNQPVSGTTVGASESGEPADCAGFTSSSPEDVWYSFTSDGNSNYIIDVIPDSLSNIDAVAYLYSGTCDSLVEVSCADVNFTTGSGETIEADSLPAGVYYVRVYNWSSGGEAFTISLSCETLCSEPFPAVDNASLDAQFNGSTIVLSWDPVPGSTVCQIQGGPAGTSGPDADRTLVFGDEPSSYEVPGFALQPNAEFQWRVRCGCSVDPLVAGPWSAVASFTTPGSAGISASPNPTEGVSFVTFTTPEAGYTTLEVFDMSGRTLDMIFSGNTQPNNEYRFEFDGSDLPNGVYIYRLTTENEVVNEKFMIAR